ncbi:hypothetical protein GGD38_003224 [Chitinophagaceae bacterium OAS944]|nr:hypothetical protein [Chitinophagaceae bacterium OAS944]
MKNPIYSNVKGELCESFVKDFLADTLGSLFKIYREGNIIKSKKEISRQLDIIRLTEEKLIKAVY